MSAKYRQKFSDKLTGTLALPKSLLSNDIGNCITEAEDVEKMWSQCHRPCTCRSPRDINYFKLVKF